MKKAEDQKTKKTDNSYLADKVGMRVKHLPVRGVIRVLDCYAGTGRIWRGVKRRVPSRDIQILAMDKRSFGFHLPGDNVAWMKQMDLSKFNVIDLDAYGIPYEQLKTLFDQKYKGIVFVTFIQPVLGYMPKGMMKAVGFTDEIMEKAPALCNARGWEYFLEWIAGNGVEKIYHRSHSRKHYICFKL